jgi:cell shape-determining protein MreD
VSEDPAKPKWKTGAIWGILAVLLVVGTLGSATFAFGLFGLLAGDPLGVIPMGVGLVVAVLAFLFTAGILYRVDRYRGATMRRIELFE